jgi:hypothetical protein
VHTGEAEEREGDYFGTAVNLAVRVMAACHGGQILVTGAPAALLRGVELVDVGVHQLPGIGEPVQLFQVRAEGVAGGVPAPADGRRPALEPAQLVRGEPVDQAQRVRATVDWSQFLPTADEQRVQEPQAFAQRYPRIGRVLGSNRITRQSVWDRLQDEAWRPWENDVGVAIAFQLIVTVMAEAAGQDRQVKRALASEQGRLELLEVGLAVGYAVGRMALRSDNEVISYSADDHAMWVGLEIGKLAAALEFDDVASWCADTETLELALYEMDIKDLIQVRRESVQWIKVLAKQRGFLVAIAQDVIVRGA